MRTDRGLLPDCYRLAGIIGIDPGELTLAELKLMVTGWQEEVGDLVALLRVDIQNSGETRPRHGAKFDSVHPYQSIVKRRRRLLPKGDIALLKALIPPKGHPR